MIHTLELIVEHGAFVWGLILFDVCTFEPMFSFEVKFLTVERFFPFVESSPCFMFFRFIAVNCGNRYFAIGKQAVPLQELQGRFII